MARRRLHIACAVASVIGFALVAIGFSTRYWFFCENSRWQFKCDLRTCCVRDIEPAPKLWTCWPIKDPPKWFRVGAVLTSCGLGLWLPSVICLLAARAKFYSRQTRTLGLCFLMVAGTLGMIGCKILFQTAREDFIIAEHPGVSGYITLSGFALTFLASALSSAELLMVCVQRTLACVGTALGCLAALLYAPVRAVFTRLSPVYVRLKPRLQKMAQVIKQKLIIIAGKLKAMLVRLYRTVRPFVAPVIAVVRPRLLGLIALVVLVVSAGLTFVQTKLAAILTSTLTKLAAVLIVLSPRLYALISSARERFGDKASLRTKTLQLIRRLSTTVLVYLEGLVRPSFERTLEFLRTVTSRSSHRTVLSKAMALQAISVHQT